MKRNYWLRDTIKAATTYSMLEVDVLLIYLKSKMLKKSYFTNMDYQICKDWIINKSTYINGIRVIRNRVLVDLYNAVSKNFKKGKKNYLRKIIYKTINQKIGLVDSRLLKKEDIITKIFRFYEEQVKRQF